MVRPEALVGLGVLVVAHPDHGGLQQPHHSGHHLLARQTALVQVVIDLVPQRRQDAAEGGHAGELGLRPGGAPQRVVAVLLAAPLVAAGGLDVAARGPADPDVGVGRRDDQGADAVEGPWVGDRAALCVDIVEAGPGLHPGEAGVVVVDVDQAGGFGDVLVGGVFEGRVLVIVSHLQATLSAMRANGGAVLRFRTVRSNALTVRLHHAALGSDGPVDRSCSEAQKWSPEFTVRFDVFRSSFRRIDATWPPLTAGAREPQLLRM